MKCNQTSSICLILSAIVGATPAVAAVKIERPAPYSLTSPRTKPSVRGSWSPRSKSGWHLGVSMEHYRCHHTWIPETMPTMGKTEAVLKAAGELEQALQNSIPQETLTEQVSHEGRRLKLPSAGERSSTPSALSVRGGGVANLPEQLQTFAKAATICTGATAAVTYLAPATATESLYGLPNTSPLVVWLIRALGGSLAMIAVQAYCILFKGMSYTKAIGYGCLPFMINEIRTLVLNETRQWNMPPWGLLFISLPISSSCAYTLISDKSFANKIAKFFAFWVLVGNGLPLGLAPEAAANGWGIDAGEKGALEALQLIGLADIAAAVFMILLDRGADVVLAFASSFSLLAILMLEETIPRLRAS